MIRISGLTKSFKVYAQPLDRVIELFSSKEKSQKIFALNNVSFDLNRGETIGIIGRNGSGKSTLLKILMGTLLPDSGTLEVSGNVCGLLELGTGFNYDLSGYQNISFNARLLGMTDTQICDRESEIIKFSELYDSIKFPIRTYSTGMLMRLAFAIAIHAEPEILIIDEALSVGDVGFQQKCMQKIALFRKNGGSLIFVSHDLNAVNLLCDRVLVLENGILVENASPTKAIETYYKLQSSSVALESSGVGTSNNLEEIKEGYGSKLVRIVDARLSNTSTGGDAIAAGDPVTLVFTLEASIAVCDITLGFLIRDRFGQDIFGTNTFYLHKKISVEADSKKVVIFSLPMAIAPGGYTLTCALHSGETHHENCYHWIDNIINFEISGYAKNRFSGIAMLIPEVRVIDGEAAPRQQIK
jgi:lipopolysaccharide transport system ATP-binding protein